MHPVELAVWVGLYVLQILAALPWVFAGFLTGSGYESTSSSLGARSTSTTVYRRKPTTVLDLGLRRLMFVAVGLAIAAFLPLIDYSPGTLEGFGHLYCVLLQLQLTIDFFVLAFALALAVWPKGGAVALAAFREGVRQPMFWLLAVLAFFALTILPFIPYFTFGEDYTMVKELGYDTIMFAALLFGSLAACLFVTEEIEGRTAVTLLSKPVSRRQFLLGKFFGIVLAALLMFGLLGIWFEEILLYKHSFERMDAWTVPQWVSIMSIGNWSSYTSDFLRGAGMFAQHIFQTVPGLLLTFSQVMVLVAISVSLATRVPMVVNLTTILVIYFMAHLTPVLLVIGQNALRDNPGPVAQLLMFVSQLFDTLLPDLEAFRVSTALLGTESNVPVIPFIGYLASVSLYGILYTSIVLVFGLILFEDRDLA